MNFFFAEPVIVEALATALREPEKQTSYLFLAASENAAQQIFAVLNSLVQGVLPTGSVQYFPGFVQSGLFRFESAKRTLGKRIGFLNGLNRYFPKFIIVAPGGYFRLTPTTSWVRSQSLDIEVGRDLDQEFLLEVMTQLGYLSVDTVEEIGEYAVRGGIVDIFSPTQLSPIRLEFFGDTVENIRAFRPGDQRSFASLKNISIGPIKEFSWPSNLQMSVTLEKFNAVILSQGLTSQVRMQLLENLRHGVPFPGVDDVHTFFSDTPMLPFYEFIQKAAEENNFTLKHCAIAPWQKIEMATKELVKFYGDALVTSQNKGFLSIGASVLYPRMEDFFVEDALDKRPEANFKKLARIEGVNSSYSIPDNINAVLKNGYLKKFTQRCSDIIDLIRTKKISGVTFVASSQDIAIEISSLLQKHIEHEIQLPLLNFKAEQLLANSFDTKFSQQSHIHFEIGTLHAGFFLPALKRLVLSGDWLRGSKKEDSIEVFADDVESSKTASQHAAKLLLQNQFQDFSVNDLVVHVQHGVARFLGIHTVSVLDITADFLCLEYAGQDKIYVPIHKMNLVQRYLGGEGSDSAVLDSLKGQQWEKRKVKAKADAEKLAKELMEQQAKRAMTPGFAFRSVDEDYLAFEAAFPYDETPCQTRVMREILADMQQPKAMDRLVCGDVGFGKTELAMRAAYRAVLDGKQVAVLVPTTVLAHQHWRSFQERFQDFQVSVEMLDRSVSGASTKSVLQKLIAGQCDIVVGTHKLLSADIKFKDLGLLIVDEEQRFGVLQKEKIKSMSYGIDVLTMTATPIPRTLQLALLGLRDLSLLTTPPKSRLAVKTLVCPFEENIVSESIQAELSRGGQVFYVHNRVEDLESVRLFLNRLIPKARIAIGHGKMQQKELNDTIIAFLENQYDILLCTTIIESGVDYPGVNTIIVQNANNFGLAQLYQLRGRVGRRSSRGYAFFLVADMQKEDDEGYKRLKILKEHQDLGSGFVIASHDLEMRGAGNILGDDQKGRVSDVGLDTYTQMLEQAIRELGGQKVRAQTEAEISVPFTAQIPQDYIGNSKERLKYYRKFFNARDEEVLKNLTAECLDRFGPLPGAVDNLADLARLRRWLLVIGATSLTVREDGTEVRLSPEVLQAQDEETQRLVTRILDVCNRKTQGMRIFPDGRILIPVRKQQFIKNHAEAIGELKRIIALVAGEMVT